MAHQYTLDCEKITHEFSPGVVEDEEPLLRLLYVPEHVVNDVVIETAIPLDDLKSRGLSLDRMTFAKKEIIQERMDKQMIKDPVKRQEASLAKFCCSDIRSIVDPDTGDRKNLVIDDAMEANIAHASIFSHKEMGKGALRKQRTVLLEYLQDRYCLDALFN